MNVKRRVWEIVEVAKRGDRLLAILPFYLPFLGIDFRSLRRCAPV